MPMIQIRHVPAPLHRKLKARAALKGVSLSHYLLEEIRRVAESPTDEEFIERLRSRSPVHDDVSTAQIIREERDRR